MASFVQTQSSMPKVGEIIDEIQWLIHIHRTLEEELEDETEVPISIFSVPRVLISSDPDLCTPQQVAIGPCHHWRPEMYEMERYKLAAAKRSQKQLQRIKFQNLVEQLEKLEPRVRACYHKYLDFNSERLAWMMAIDASFLLEFLQSYTIKEGKMLLRVSSRMSHLVDFAGRKSAHNAILRDIVMKSTRKQDTKECCPKKKHTRDIYMNLGDPITPGAAVRSPNATETFSSLLLFFAAQVYPCSP